jgi:hypothetical protein
MVVGLLAVVLVGAGCQHQGALPHAPAPGAGATGPSVTTAAPSTRPPSPAAGGGAPAVTTPAPVAGDLKSLDQTLSSIDGELRSSDDETRSTEANPGQ